MTKLTLKRPLSLETQAKLAILKNTIDPPAPKSRPDEKKAAPLLKEPTKKERSMADKESQQKARQRFQEAKSWVEATFPQAFNFQNPKPLQCHIHHEIMGMTSPYTRKQIRKVLAAYTCRRAYLKAFQDEDWRYNLQGEKAEPLTAEHKANARQKLEGWKPQKKRSARQEPSHKIPAPFRETVIE